MRVHVLVFVVFLLAVFCVALWNLSTRQAIAAHVISIAPPRLWRTLRLTGNIAKRRGPAVCILIAVHRHQQNRMLIPLGRLRCRRCRPGR